MEESKSTSKLTSLSSISKYLDEEATNTSKIDSLTVDYDEALNDSFFGSISEGDEHMLIQKIPTMKCTQISIRSQKINPENSFGSCSTQSLPYENTSSSLSPKKPSYDKILKNSIEQVLHPKPFKSPSKENIALFCAIEKNDLSSIINIITSTGPKPEANYKWEGHNTFLHIAAEKGLLKISEALLDYLEDIHLNARNNDMMQPLHLASWKGHMHIAQLLVRSGADLNPIDINGNTPLHLACLGKFSSLVSWLLSRGPNINIQNKQGKTAEELASDEIKAIFRRYIRKTTIVNGPSLSESQKLSALRAKVTRSTQVSPKQFSVLQPLGKGSFGEVYLVRNVCTGMLYAMKVLDKEKIISKNLTIYALTERNVLSQINHPFMVSLHFAFQSNEKLFLILDYCPGGDLARHLSVEKKFSEARSKVYLCEIILALEELHKRDIIFRDLKPDNIVLDADGHAILTDFGLSKEGVSNSFQAKSFCGSIAYLAPEVLKRKGHGKCVDWYLLGVLFYEMVVGYPPYFTVNKNELINNIQKGKLKIPASLSLDAKELIKDVRNI
jgi:protein-serine/threonine kinase